MQGGEEQETAEQRVPESQRLQDEVSTVWKTIAWRRIQVAEVTWEPRELIGVREIGLSDTEEINHAMEERW